MKYFLPLSLLLAACAQPDPHSEAAHGRKVMGLQEKFDRFDYNADGKLMRPMVASGPNPPVLLGRDASGSVVTPQTHYAISADTGYVAP